MILSRLDLPAPFTPTSPTFSRGLTWKEMSSRIVRSPRIRPTFWTVSIENLAPPPDLGRGRSARLSAHVRNARHRKTADDLRARGPEWAGSRVLSDQDANATDSPSPPVGTRSARPWDLPASVGASVRSRRCNCEWEIQRVHSKIDYTGRSGGC